LKTFLKKPLLFFSGTINPGGKAPGNRGTTPKQGHLGRLQQQFAKNQPGGGRREAGGAWGNGGLGGKPPGEGGKGGGGGNHHRIDRGRKGRIPGAIKRGARARERGVGSKGLQTGLGRKKKKSCRAKIFRMAAAKALAGEPPGYFSPRGRGAWLRIGCCRGGPWPKRFMGTKDQRGTARGHVRGLKKQKKFVDLVGQTPAFWEGQKPAFSRPPGEAGGTLPPGWLKGKKTGQSVRGSWGVQGNREGGRRHFAKAPNHSEKRKQTPVVFEGGLGQAGAGRGGVFFEKKHAPAWVISGIWAGHECWESGAEISFHRGQKCRGGADIRPRARKASAFFTRHPKRRG